MTDKNLTEIVCVIDRSSSMLGTRREVIDGFNKFVAEQRLTPGKALLTCALFDTNYQLLFDGVPLDTLGSTPLNDDNYMPMGCTALLDAVGATIDAVGGRLSRTDEDKRPSKVLVLIMTDGQENSSQRYKGDRISEMVRHQTEKYQWEFVFLGANIDSFATAAQYNITGAVANYVQTSAGTMDAFQRLSKGATRYRGTGKVGDIS